MIIFDNTARSNLEETNASLDRMVARIIKQKVSKMTNEKIEELETAERRLRKLLADYLNELPPGFIQQARHNIETISKHIEWINKEMM